MAEEMNDQGTDSGAVDSGIESVETSPDTMTGDFFDEDAFYDEGMDAVVDNYGNPIKNDKGEEIKTMDDYRSTKDGDGPNKKPEKGENDEGGESAKFDSLFQKDGEFDFDGLMKTSSNVRDYSYEMQSKIKQPEPGQVGYQAAVDPKTHISTGVNELSEKLTAERLEPIKSIYNDAVNRVTNAYANLGQQVPQEVNDAIHQAFNTQYMKEEEGIKTAVDSRRNELLDDALSQKATDTELKENKTESSKNFKSVSDKMLPDVPEGKREEFLSELVFGRVNDKNQHEPGYGTDLVNAFFDEAMSGKEFSSPQELQQSYNNWWYKFSSNPSKVQLISMLSYSRFLLANPEGLRGAYRKSFEKESANKNKNKNNQSRSSGVAMDNLSDPLMEYHRGT